MSDNEMMPVEAEAGGQVMVSAKSQVRPLVLSDMSSMWKFAGCLAESGMLPKSYTGTVAEKRAKAVIAIQLGAEVGLQPMQSVQNIAVVNGQPSIWGDAQLALVKGSGLLEYHKEEVTGTGTAMLATVTTKRKGEAEVVRTFSWSQAVRAGFDKKDTYKGHPERMLTYRARAYALRDVFPDVLKGLTHTYEEMQDVTPQAEPGVPLSNKAASINASIAAEAEASKNGVQEAEAQPAAETEEKPGEEAAEVAADKPPLSDEEEATLALEAANEKR